MADHRPQEDRDFPLHLRETPQGVAFDAVITPRAFRSGIAEIREGAVRLRIAAPPVEGKANAECLLLLSSVLGIPKRQIRIVSGQGSRRKTIAVAGLSPEAIRTALRPSDP